MPNNNPQGHNQYTENANQRKSQSRQGGATASGQNSTRSQGDSNAKSGSSNRSLKQR